jgi:hypothetical protein
MDSQGMSAKCLHEAWKSSSVAGGNELEQNLEVVFHQLEPFQKNKTLENAKIFSSHIGQVIRNAGKTKYKPVDKKKNPLALGVSREPVIRHPYKDLPPVKKLPLPTHPLCLKDFKYTKKLTPERITKIISNIPNNFLSEQELDLLLCVVARQEDALAFDEAERGIFKQEYFPDYIMETVPHEPWTLKPIRPPKAIVATLIQMIKDQLKAGKYKNSWSSYRSQMFAVAKPKGGIRIVHDLQPLNAVSVKDSSLPPNINDFADSFVGHSVYIVADLFAGYDGRRLAEDSQELTTTDSPLGPVKLTSLPQGYTNSMQEFMRTVTHMIRPLIPDKAEAFVDDVAGKGPKSRYDNKSIPENPNIRQYIWEFAHVVDELFATFALAGCTASGNKLVLATPLIHIVGNVCSMEGRRPHHGIITKIINWPRPTNVSQVRGFLGTVGVTRNWIWQFAKIAKPLTLLTKKLPHEFEWNDQAEKAMNELKEISTKLPARKALDITIAAVGKEEERTSDYGLVTLAVDSSIIAVGWIEFQTLEDGRHPIVFGSTTNNEAEAKYSQPQIELKGLFKALKSQRNDLWGIHFKVEVDAKFLKQTINTPGLPNAAMSRWVSYIQLFDFELEHVPATKHHGPDGLSRRPAADNDSINTDEELEPDEPGHFITGPRFLDEINPLALKSHPPSELNFAKLKIESYEDPFEPKWTNGAFIILPQNKQAHHGGFVALSFQSSASDQSKPKTLDPTNLDTLHNDNHPHKIKDRDGVLYWSAIEDYLKNMKTPSSTAESPFNVKNIRSFIQTTRRYFIHENTLWRRGSHNQLPRKVIKNETDRNRLCKAAHDESGHRGRDPTLKKLSDRFFWPNMLTYVARYCRTCHECQRRSSTRPKITLSPTYVNTILRKFNMDTVHMPSSGGFKYIVDLRDDLSGWLEAKMLRSATSKNVAKFLFEDVMCRFGCVLQITTDNGGEFDGVVQALADEYNVPIARATPYHPEANGMIERSHRTWIGSLFIACKGNPNQWSKYFYACMWADRVTTRRTTGHTPYYLLYGKHHIFPFDITDSSWYTLNWHSIKTTEELLAIRAVQLAHKDEDINTASNLLLRTRIKSAQDYARRNEHLLVEGNYPEGTIVLVFNSTLLMQHGRKGEIRWIGPYRVRRQNDRGSYELNELDGTPMTGVYAGNRLKKYHLRDYLPSTELTDGPGHSEVNDNNSYEAESNPIKLVTMNDQHSRKQIPLITKFWGSPVSLGPENQLRTYLWPPPRVTDSWGYWENKFVEWKRRDLIQQLSDDPLEASLLKSRATKESELRKSLDPDLLENY